MFYLIALLLEFVFHELEILNVPNIIMVGLLLIKNIE